MNKQNPKETNKDKKTPPQGSVLTKVDFLNVLKKANRPVLPKAFPVMGKRKMTA